jgi:hypothetical protein
MVGGSTSNLTIKATATTPSGSLYVAGSFSGFVTIGTTTLYSTGGTDGFLAKWNPTTNDFVWAYRLGGTDLDQVTTLALNGNRVYLAGTFFSPTASFGAINIANAGGLTIIGTDAFVAELTDAGPSASFDWALPLGGPGQDAATSLVANGSNVYVGGQFASATATFGSISLANSTPGTTSATPDGFVAKLVDAGPSVSASWVRPITGPAGKYVSALALNGTSVYATGYFGGLNAAFGTTSLPNAGGAANAYVAKIADAGTTSTWQWALRAGGTGQDAGTALAVRGTKVYVAGSFSSSAMPLGSFTIVNAGSAGTTDAFVAALADTGPTATWQWAQQAGGTSNDQATVLTTYGASGVCLGGTFTSAVVTMGSTTLASTSGGALVANLTDTGTTAIVNWAQRGGGTTAADVACLALAGTQLYLAGSFRNTAPFGSQTLASSSPNASTNFLALLTDPVLTATAKSALNGVAFALFPNPARRAATVQLPAVPGATAATITLLDAMGRVVRTATAPLLPTGLRHELDLTNMAPGLYVLQVRAGTAVAVRQLLVE